MDETLSRDIKTRLRNQLVEENYEILKFYLLTKILSPVRNQGQTLSCSHVCIVASVEMLYRDSGILIDGSKSYYFDVKELFDHACSPASRADVLGHPGIDMHTVTSFVINNGLKSVPTCTDPRPRDLAARFDTTVKRHKITSFVKLSPDDVLVVAKALPVIACLIPYWSFRRRSKSIYHGPTKREVKNKNSFNILHDVLIVGLTKIRRGNKVEKFVIIQNSWGSRFGVSGFAIVPFDCENLFVEFFAPYGPIPDQDPQAMASSSARSKRSRKSYGSSAEGDYDNGYLVQSVGRAEPQTGGSNLGDEDEDPEIEEDLEEEDDEEDLDGEIQELPSSSSDKRKRNEDSHEDNGDDDMQPYSKSSKNH